MIKQKMDNVERIVRDYLDRWNSASGMNRMEIQEGVFDNSFNTKSYYLWVSYQNYFIFRAEVELSNINEEEAKSTLYNKFLETTFLYGIGARFSSTVNGDSDSGWLDLNSTEKLN